MGWPDEHIGIGRDVLIVPVVGAQPDLIAVERREDGVTDERLARLNAHVRLAVVGKAPAALWTRDAEASARGRGTATAEAW